MEVADFEARYRGALDPWDYRTSPYERAKYAATLRACGPGPFRSALELGASIGEFTALLAPRCRRLLAVDASPTAAERARARLWAWEETVAVAVATIPDELPPGRFDLVVASEILYYLTAAELRATLDGLRERLVPGGRIVAVHWRPDGPERPLGAAAVHATLRAQPWLSPVASGHTPDYLLDALVRR